MAEKKRSDGGPGGDSVGGSLTLSDDVVATIAGLAARQVAGIHKLGKSRLIAFGDDPKRGVGVEVGQREAAFDLEVVIEYGCNIHDTVDALRKKIAEVVDAMAGRQVVEVNINVVDIHLPDPEQPPTPQPNRRVE